MSVVKMNDASYDEIITNVLSAKEKLVDSMENIWGKNFDNLYHNFITNGFLDDLYKDAESSFSKVMKSCSFIGCVGTTVAAASHVAALVTAGAFCASIPVIGWIAAGVLALIGIVMVVKNFDSVNFDYEARIAFQNLLESCVNGADDSYIAQYNINTKLENCRLSLQKIIYLINEYQTENADLTDSAKEAGVKTVVAQDGLTVTGIETTITVDGNEITTTTSEALNAFYTYTETVTSAVIEADYLERTYGIDINYTDIVKNANSFITDTLNSGLYTHEFINSILPEYNPSQNDAVNSVSSLTGLTADQINEAIKNNKGLVGTGALAAGILGLSLIGNVVGGSNNTGATPGGTTPGGTTPGGTSGGTPSGGTPSGGNNSGGNNPGGNTGGNNSGGNNPGGTTPPSDDDKNTGGDDKKPEDDKDKDKDPEDDKEPKPVNDIKIPEISDSELPKEIEIPEVDYDKLAREQFEFEGDFDDIMQDRTNLIEQVEMQYDNGDMAPLETKLKDFGYNEAEVTAILGSKFLTSKAILEGTQRQMLAEKAEALAVAAGDKDFVSDYRSRPNYADLSETEASKELTLTSGDKKVTDAYDKMKESREDYYDKAKEANDALVDVNENKKTMEELKAKYEKEYGEDTSQWSSEAAQEYSDAIEDYNKSLDDANTKFKEAEDAEKAYTEANSDFEKAKEDFLKNGSSEEVENPVTPDTGTTVTTGTQGSTPITDPGINGGNSDNPVFDYVPAADNVGVTVDGQTQGVVNNTPSQPITNGLPGMDQNAINAAVASSTDEILKRLKAEDGDLIST